SAGVVRRRDLRSPAQSSAGRLRDGVSAAARSEVIPALDSSLCHHATVWSGCWFALNLSLNQTATLVLSSVFQSVFPPEGERFGGRPWPTNCSLEASPSRRPRPGSGNSLQGPARSNRRRW